MTVSKVSVGSVLNPGQQFITLVPTDAPLEVEANIAGTDDGHVMSAIRWISSSTPSSTRDTAWRTASSASVSPDSFTAQDEQRNPTGAVPLAQQRPAAFGIGPGSPWIRSTCTTRRPTSI